MAHVFVSYVRENADQIDKMTLDLFRRGVDTWTDREIGPGQRWKLTIRHAIRKGVSFLACFSPEAVERGRSYMNEEITTAIEVLRELPTDTSWFLPVRLAQCAIPDRDIGAGHTLRDLQQVDLFPDWDSGIAKIVSVIREALTYSQPVSTSSTEPRLPDLRNEPQSSTLAAWRSTWSSLFRLKVAGDALFTRVDQDNLQNYGTCLDEAIRNIGESASFSTKTILRNSTRCFRGHLDCELAN
jgi:hypothetical protein